ncbi:hypothetical protein [Sphingobium sp. SA916]|uniref:hypothetical protein n=1 Tax=Sphingobium sp. SA916 TaxID=1851207 RepID=UPI000ABBAA0B|nr:hypothetical protein [Sphingobium sp. SA916]
MAMRFHPAHAESSLPDIPPPQKQAAFQKEAIHNGSKQQQASENGGLRLLHEHRGPESHCWGRLGINKNYYGYEMIICLRINSLLS